MKKFLLLVTLSWISWFSIQTNAQQPDFNLSLLSNVNDYPSDGYNDIWGFVDENGIEYAVLGTRRATAIYSLEDPTNPIERAYIPGGFSLWRDMKSFGDFVYVTVDLNQNIEITDGLLVINMTNAPNDITWEFWNPTLQVNGQLSQLRTCHNIYIDEFGFAYLSGCNLNNGGILILDVHTTPGTPELVGFADPRYSHDNYTRDNLIYSADINDGIFSIIDVTDKSNPVTIATQQTSFAFTHNTWLSDDGNYLFTTDERRFAFVDSYDISDFDNIQRLDSYRPPTTENEGTIPHNTHYHNGYLVTSWYTDGIKIIDANRPDILVEVGSYDTFLNPVGDGGDGCWGAYPFLPSGIVLGSDQQTGLYVLQPDYQRASYLEGDITDAVTGAVISNVDFAIDAVLIEDQSDPFGRYKTGLFGEGTFTVSFDHPEYLPTSVTVELIQGQTVIQDVQMTPRERGALRGKVTEALTGNPIPNAQVIAFNSRFTHLTETDANGEYVIEDVVLELYSIGAGKWGFLHENRNWNYLVSNSAQNFELGDGYQDDFVFDFNWTATDGIPFPETGRWERGIPIGTTYFGNQANPAADENFDFGRECWMTGNGGGGAGTDDIDEGTVVLTSPVIDLSEYVDPRLSFSYWLFSASVNPPDVFTVEISNGTQTEVILQTTVVASNWRRIEDIALRDIIEFNENMTITLTIGDVNEQQVLEAGLDAFLIIDANPVSTVHIDLEDVSINAYPNPFEDAIRFDYELPESVNRASFRIFNALGQAVGELPVVGITGTVTWNDQVPAGIYFVQLQLEGQVAKTIRVIKRN